MDPRSERPLGVLWSNLGSPSAPSSAAVREFLDEFLGDPLVVDANPLAWWLLRKLVILPLRAPKSAGLYRRVWTSEGSPLLVHSLRFARALARELGPGYRVALGMRYGRPSIADGLRELVQAGCARVLLLPAFPQASRTTTVTAERQALRALAALPEAPELVTAPPYFAEPGFVRALAARARAALEQGPVDHFVFSFHGLPVRYVEEGDPYRDQCEATARALARELALAEGDWTLVYQSRFGREPWLGPDAAERVPALATRYQRVLLLAPSFTADCLETLEELGLRLSAAFTAAGGQELRLVPCLNDHPSWVEAAARIARAALREVPEPGRAARRP
jgi:ferrochelatase